MASSITLPDFNFATHHDEDCDEEDYDAEGEEYDEAEDLDAEAEAMARRLGDQLLADIAKAQAEAAAAGAKTPRSPQPPTAQQTTYQRKREAALLTMKGILAFAAKHPIVDLTMSTSQVLGPESGNFLEVLNRCVSTSTVTKPLARALIEVVLSLAKSDGLFGSLRNSDAPAMQLDKGKRKRDHVDEPYTEPPQKRVAIAIPVDQPDLLRLMGEAIHAITRTLTTSSPIPSQGPSINPAVISSIQLPLHQVFLFAVTSACRAGDGRVQALQELAGLVQMIGVLSGIPIGNPPPQWHVLHGGVPPPTDIGTAVYPCLVPGCQRTFHRLYSLRTHQRLHTFEHRPHRCAQCPASFVRNHDLKRHALLHEKKAWRCAGCNKIFSRRDAIKRHKDARGRAAGGVGKGRSGEADPVVDAACAYADIETVEIDRVHGEAEISRRAKLWDEIAASAGGTMADHMGPEEGEIDPDILHRAQDMVLQIHGLLQAEVAKGLGTPAAPAPMPPPHVSQSTLASIIARAQQSSVPPDVTGGTQPPVDVPAEDLMSLDAPAPSLETDEPPASAKPPPTPPPLSHSWLSEEQTRMLEQAIAQASSAAQAQAEAEAALEEEEEGEDFDFDDDERLEE